MANRFITLVYRRVKMMKSLQILIVLILMKCKCGPSALSRCKLIV